MAREVITALERKRRAGRYQKKVGKLQAGISRTPARGKKDRKARLKSGRLAAKNLVQGTIRANTGKKRKKKKKK